MTALKAWPWNDAATKRQFSDLVLPSTPIQFTWLVEQNFTLSLSTQIRGEQLYGAFNICSFCPVINVSKEAPWKNGRGIRECVQPRSCWARKRKIRLIRNRKHIRLPHVCFLLLYQYAKCLVKQNTLQMKNTTSPQCDLFTPNSWVDTLSYLTFWKLYCQTSQNIESSYTYPIGLEQNHMELQIH